MEKLKILGHEYEVHFAEKMADNSKIYGVHIPKTLKIFVDGGVPNSVTLETLWHEIHEAISYWNSLEIDHSVLCGFAANSMAVLLANPWIINMINEYIALGSITPVITELEVEDYMLFQKMGESQGEEEARKYEEKCGNKGSIQDRTRLPDDGARREGKERTIKLFEGEEVNDE